MLFVPGDDAVWNRQTVRIVDTFDTKLLKKHRKAFKDLRLVAARNGQLVWVNVEGLTPVKD